MELEDQLRRLKVSREIDQSILANQNVNHTLEILLSRLLDELKVDAAAVLSLSTFSQTLEYIADRGFQTDTFHQVHLRLGEDYAGQVAMQRKPMLLGDLKAARGTVQPRWVAAENFQAYLGFPLISKNQLRGVMEVFHRGVYLPEAETLEFLQSLADQAAMAVENAAFLEEIQTTNVELAQAYTAAVEGWARTLEVRDLEAPGHIQRVTELTLSIARSIGIVGKDLEQVRHGALLHDIGKFGISDGILLKPGPLTPEEWAVMRKHPVYAYQMLSPNPFLRQAAEIPYCHHEKWDGTGYPQGLKEESIPLAARIFAVADVWDALRSERPYHRAWSDTDALEYIRQQSGSYFDPQIVDVFLAIRK